MNGLRFDRETLDFPIYNSDSQLYELATDFIEQQYSSVESALRTRVRLIVERLLPVGNCAAASVAAVFGINNARTLGRRLRLEGESFDEILDSVRRDVVIHYLRQPAISLTRVAEMIGYSSTQTLSQSCARWYSASSRQLRNRWTSELW